MTVYVRPWSLVALLAVLGFGWLVRRGQQLEEVPHMLNLDPDLLYAVCENCAGEGGGCIDCFDIGVVPHRED